MSPEDDLRGLETIRAHQRHARIGEFLELLLGKYGPMTARQMLTAYIDEKWPFKTVKPRVDANQISKLVKKCPNIVAEPRDRRLAYSLKQRPSH